MGWGETRVKVSSFRSESLHSGVNSGVSTRRVSVQKMTILSVRTGDLRQGSSMSRWVVLLLRGLGDPVQLAEKDKGRRRLGSHLLGRPDRVSRGGGCQ